ncbi:zinc ribbon domain-containing protein [Bradyrhizobium quebecense]|uniref:Zinc ribbon domain-containing protein n=1 Tax=Bradyrhizobium quebecense TaxID=2748629 RepID=A0ABS3MJ44_9BRAD
MSKGLPDASFRTCPSCGSVLSRGVLTCSYCGGVIAVENVLGRLRSELRFQVNRASQRLRDRNVLIWVLALCPIFILPPVLAILMCLRSSDGTQPDQGPATRGRDVVAIVILALCNLILSIMFWRWLSEISMASGFSIGLFLKSLGLSSPRSPLQSI